MRKYILPTLTLLGVIIVTFLIFKGCGDIAPEQPITPDKTDSIKKVIEAKYQMREDSILLDKKRDTLRVEVIKRYKVVIHDTILKQICAPIIQLCDSIILIDSSQISTLKNIVKLDSGIIADYRKVVVNDSTTIVGLNREIKKHKRQKKLIGGIGAVGWLIAIFK